MRLKKIPEDSSLELFCYNGFLTPSDVVKVDDSFVGVNGHSSFSDGGLSGQT